MSHTDIESGDQLWRKLVSHFRRNGPYRPNIGNVLPYDQAVLKWVVNLKVLGERGINQVFSAGERTDESR